MIDTLRMGTRVFGDINLQAFDRCQKTIDIQTGEEKLKFITLGEKEKIVPRLTYYQRERYLNFEVSLPKFVIGNNYELINDNQLITGLSDCIAWIADKLSIKTAVEMWKASRIDYCFAWTLGDDIAYYLRSMAGCPVPGYTRSPYVDESNRQQGFTWRAKSRKVNAYDKGLELGLDLGGMLRLEVQNINSDACCPLYEKYENPVSVEASKAELSRWLDRAGLTNGIRAEDDVLDHLIKEFGYEGASSRYTFLQLYKRHGSKTSKIVSKNTYTRRRAEAVKQGWLITGERNLEGLKI